MQVQLRAQEENTIKILEAIKRANILQVVFVLTLVISQVCSNLGINGTGIFSFSAKAAQILYVTGKIFEIPFTCMLSFSMKGVNEQLALFFHQVGMRNYRKKSIAVFIAAYYLLLIHYDIMSIVGFFINVGMIYYYVSVWLYLIINYSVHLVVTVVFYYLADFGFEVRTYQVKPEGKQQGFENKLIMSKALNSDEESLMADNSLDLS